MYQNSKFIILLIKPFVWCRSRRRRRRGLLKLPNIREREDTVPLRRAKILPDRIFRLVLLQNVHTTSQ